VIFSFETLKDYQTQTAAAERAGWQPGKALPAQPRREAAQPGTASSVPVAKGLGGVPRFQMLASHPRLGAGSGCLAEQSVFRRQPKRKARSR